MKVANLQDVKSKDQYFKFRFLLPLPPPGATQNIIYELIIHSVIRIQHTIHFALIFVKLTRTEKKKKKQ